MDVHFQAMTVADAPHIAQLLSMLDETSDWGVEDLRTSLMEERLRGTVVYRGAEQNDKQELLGFIYWRSIVDEVEILNLGVAKSWRRQEIGRRLMDELFSFTKSIQAKRVFLEVRESNTGAQDFYRKFGFVPCGLRSGYYVDSQEAAMLMSLALGAPI
ncbi:MAG: ribosomal protein S18-alanine N-acetyltransferase [Myxococcota bacterium]|jgi:ribosomal-protein-alanine N-acetyltransferase|nr:ribosomal protein S18-alanine N-acetyltransferase [Myxococcota bacterium]